MQASTAYCFRLCLTPQPSCSHGVSGKETPLGKESRVRGEVLPTLRLGPTPATASANAVANDTPPPDEAQVSTTVRSPSLNRSRTLMCRQS
jgi:hypothetical protein